MIKAGVFDNGIEGLRGLYQNDERVHYEWILLGTASPFSLDAFDVIIAPNGTDHIALYRVRQEIERFLERGGVLFCFDGWFTSWVPNHRWVMDNSHRSMDVKYLLVSDVAPWADYAIEDLQRTHGISGWWACGYIEPAQPSEVILTDTWHRPLLIVDETSTNGLMILSASAPLANFQYATTDDPKAYSAMASLYERCIDKAITFIQKRNG